jgi:hypothetical protein
LPNLKYQHAQQRDENTSIIIAAKQQQDQFELQIAYLNIEKQNLDIYPNSMRKK